MIFFSTCVEASSFSTRVSLAVVKCETTETTETVFLIFQEFGVRRHHDARKKKKEEVSDDEREEASTRLVLSRRFYADYLVK
tara:strand:- start:185 stop:430 length:246 start_codon:yes stop_codon:yes gene_type:complete